jgi:uncharacterized protein
MKKRKFDPFSVPKSYFLLGPRQTGKSTLLREQIPEAQYFDLLDPMLFVELANRPQALVELVQAAVIKKASKTSQTFVVDEIQKLPKLLDVVQLLISKNPKLKFIMTGSSARKLRQAGQNLLGGRARKISFGPLTLHELGLAQENPVASALRLGGLPGVRSSKTPERDLLDYVGVYLQEEIMAESLVRNIGAFGRFLAVAGLCNGEQINFEKIGSDAQVPGRTVKDYFSILHDTLVGHFLEPYRPTQSRKFVSVPKFYFFDIGVAHFINKKTTEQLSQVEQGKALEHLIFNELRLFISYTQSEAELFFWRTQTGEEVDFIVKAANGDLIAIEVKLTKNPNDRDLRGLRSSNSLVKMKRKFLICQADRPRKSEDGCEILPVMSFVKKLWDEEVF